MTRPETDPPFFIVGCGRSGTTLLRSMLDAHPDVGVPLESLFIIDYLLSDRSIATKRQLLPREFELSEWGIEVTCADLAGCRTSAELIEAVHARYLADRGKKRWGQKTPRFVRYGALLKKHFPRARFVHLIRDPRAVASSLARSSVHQSTVLHGALRWRSDVEAGLGLEERFPDDVIRVHYESLVSNPEAEIRRVCAFLGLAFDESMLQFHQQAPDDYGRYYREIHSGLSKPVSSDAAHSWRKRLSPREIALIEALAGSLMNQLGYTPEPGGGSRPSRAFRWRVKMRRIPGIFRQLQHYQRHRSGYLGGVIRRKCILRTLGPLPVNR